MLGSRQDNIIWLRLKFSAGKYSVKNKSQRNYDKIDENNDEGNRCTKIDEHI